jgi:branched-chain amino acid transport system permease protein
MLRSVTVSVGENLLGGHLTRVQLIGIAGSIILCVLTLGFLRYSLIGRQARAISDDRELAKAFALRTERIIFYTVLIAAVLAGFAAVIAGYDIDVRPTMGFYPLLLGVVVMLIGGVGSIGGAIIAAYFVALIQQVSVSFLPTKWQDVIVFIVLILFLLLRPQGFFGKDQQTIHV